MPKPKETLGAFVSRLRREYGLSQDDLRKKAGLSLSTIANIETDRKSASPQALVQIYRDGMGVSDGQWHEIIARWVWREFGAELRASEVASMSRVNSLAENADQEARAERFLEVIRDFTPEERETFLRFGELVRVERPLMEVLRVILDRKTSEKPRRAVRYRATRTRAMRLGGGSEE